MIFLQLAFAFFKIGLLTVGGGLAMIPVIRNEMLKHSWLTDSEFLDIFGISQMTPGPISTNTATFVGFQTAAHQFDSISIAIAAALIATISVSTPSFICIGVLGSLWKKNREHPAIVCIFKIMRPLVCGLVAAAALSMCIGSLNNAASQSDTQLLLSSAIAITSFAVTAFSKFSPVATLLLGALAGVAFA